MNMCTRVEESCDTCKKKVVGFSDFYYRLILYFFTSKTAYKNVGFGKLHKFVAILIEVRYDLYI